MSKFHAFMLQPTFSFPIPAPRTLSTCLVLGVLALFSGTPAQAEKADRAKPMNIEADTMRYDDLRQTSVFSGNVVISKGTILIRGARINVRQDPEGYQSGTVTAEPGKRAYFRQKRDAPGDEWIEGESEVIEYDGRTDKVRFVRQAVMRRLVGTVVNDETSGALIVYDQSNDTFSVDGASTAAGTGTSTSGRVRAMLTPRQNAAASDAPPPAAAPAPALRPSTTLNAPSGKQ